MNFKYTAYFLALSVLTTACSNTNRIDQASLQSDCVNSKSIIYSQSTVETKQAKVTITNTLTSLSAECEYLNDKPLDKDWLLLCDQLAKEGIGKHINNDEYLLSKQNHFLFTQNDTVELVNDLSSYDYSNFSIKRSLTKKHQKSDGSIVEESAKLQAKIKVE